MQRKGNYQSDAFKSKGGGPIGNTNEETGAAAWKYNENRFHPSQPGQKFDMASYNAQALKNAQQKAGGILNTNAESGYDNWQWGNYSQQQQIDMNAYRQQQLANAKKSGGILNTNVESGDWTGLRYNPPGQQVNPNAVDRNQMPFGSKPGAVDRNQLPFGSKPGQPVDRNQMPFGSKGGQPVDRNQLPFGSKQGQPVDRNQMPFGSKGGQPVDKNQMPFGSKGNPDDVIKMDTENKFVMEGGKKKKITTIKKTLANGEIVTEIYKTDA